MHVTSTIPRDHMTEEEALTAGQIVLEVHALRSWSSEHTTLKCDQSRRSLELSEADTNAVIALLIERRSAELVMLGVTLKETPK